MGQHTTTKTCPRCTTVKAIDDYYLLCRGRNKRSSMCKACDNQRRVATGRRTRAANPKPRRNGWPAVSDTTKARILEMVEQGAGLFQISKDVGFTYQRLHYYRQLGHI